MMGLDSQKWKQRKQQSKIQMEREAFREESEKMRSRDEVKKMLNKALHPCGVRGLSQEKF